MRRTNIYKNLIPILALAASAAHAAEHYTCMEDPCPTTAANCMQRTDDRFILHVVVDPKARTVIADGWQSPHVLFDGNEVVFSDGNGEIQRINRKTLYFHTVIADGSFVMQAIGHCTKE